MRTTWQRSTIALVIFIALLLVFCGLSLLRQSAPKNRPGEVTILAKDRLYGTNMKMIMWKFKTDDTKAVQKNQAIAEKLLPDIIRQAEQENVDSIVVQAVQRKSLLIMSYDSSYGYVWNKGVDGQWHHHADNEAARYSTQGNTYYQQQQYQQAVDAFSQSLKSSPRQTEVLAARGLSYTRLRQFNNAIQDLSSALQIVGSNNTQISARGQLCYLRGLTFFDMHKDRQCIADLQTYLSSKFTANQASANQCAVANNDIAWLMATSPDAAVRNANEAIRYAKQGIPYATEGLLPAMMMDTLAAAEARAGQYPLAVASEMKAIAQVTDEQLKSGMQQRLQLYQQQKPHTEHYSSL
ncbi:MAG TPA: tetratricopeptide repeat protein [Armatimonadota bacterium]|jgi:tetratricopeptide (TPR) repeat protein